MNILNDEIEQQTTEELIPAFREKDMENVARHIQTIFEKMLANIPGEKRISYGRVHVIKTFANFLYPLMEDNKLAILPHANDLFDKGDDFVNQGVALALFSIYGLDHFEEVFPCFETAATSENWDVREFAQLFFRKLIKKYPEKAKFFLLHRVHSDDPRIRRFVAETLRPVQENRWFYKYPEYPLSVIRHLFKEPAPYPRTAVGNNLSDLSRHLPDLVYLLVEELVNFDDKNALWIATRACRNLVKKEPIRVMDLLKVDEYKYKKKVYKRNDYQ